MTPSHRYEALVLGVAQDGGVPHIACSCPNCERAALSQGSQQYAVRFALLERPAESGGSSVSGSRTSSSFPADPVGGGGDQDGCRAWLIDCGPDIREQWRMVTKRYPGCRLEGIFLTHLHMGHYIGLHQFGKEAAQARGLKIYCTASASAFFTSNQPWKYHVERGVFEMVEVRPGEGVQVGRRGEPGLGGLTVTPVAVPHRQEFSDTVGFSIQGPTAGVKLFWCPDIDSWQAWEPEVKVREVVQDHSTSFLDACFFSPKELMRRDMGQIPHPLVPDTMERLTGLGGRVRLIHLNHTNPLWDEGSEERKDIQRLGFTVGMQGEVFVL